MSAKRAVPDTPPPAARLRSFHAQLDRAWLDAAIAAAIVAELTLECWLDPKLGDADRLVTTVAILLFGLAIALRRRWPAGALALGCAVVAVQAAAGGRLSASNGVAVLVGVALLCYSAAISLSPRRSLAARALGLLALGTFVFDASTSAADAIGAELFVLTLAFAVPSFLAHLARERARRAAAFDELATQIGCEQRQRERTAIAQERARIGRELQDIIAHSVSAMVIQAGAAGQHVRSDPAQARASIVTVERTGREALADLRRMLGVLRKDDDPRILSPQPGLDQLATLIDSTRGAGVDCELREEGEGPELTPGVDLVAYRVLEAALASAVRQGSTGVGVTIRRGAQLLELELHGNGPPSGEGSLSGEGTAPDNDTASALERDLAGMRERVALYDGGLRSLPAPGGGFAVHAQLPLRLAVAA
jgi:signal transduction histidine kinase